MTTNKQNNNTEYRIDIKHPEVQGRIAEARGLYRNFSGDFKTAFDLANPESIQEAYREAEKRGIFSEAEGIRNLIYGKDMRFYGVEYVSDLCENECKFCLGSMTNHDRELRMMTQDQTVAETKHLLSLGFPEICYLTGEYPGVEEYPNRMAPYLKGLDQIEEDFEIILNIPSQTTEGFKKMRDAVKNHKLQFRVFQETYNKDTYKKAIPCGPKADYDFRRNAQSRALEAGFDKVGLGALFGIHRYPIEELDGLEQHCNEIEDKFKIIPARVALPFASKPLGCKNEVSYLLDYGQTRPTKEGETVGSFRMGDYEKCNELLYALARLAMPTSSIVSSERDTPEMLERLDRFASCTTLGVKDEVGGNLGEYVQIKEGKNGSHFKQATVFPREHKEVVQEMKSRGYNPILKV